MGDAGLEHERPRSGVSLRWSACEADAALIDQIDEDRRRGEEHEIATIDVRLVVGCPLLIAEPDAEDEGVVVGRSTLPQTFRP